MSDSFKPETLTAEDVAKDPASGTFWANYVQTRAASKVEAAEAAEKAGPKPDETAVDFHARIMRAMQEAQKDFELSDRIAAMVDLPRPSNDDAMSAQPTHAPCALRPAPLLSPTPRTPKGT